MADTEAPDAQSPANASPANESPANESTANESPADKRPRDDDVTDVVKRLRSDAAVSRPMRDTRNLAMCIQFHSARIVHCFLQAVASVLSECPMTIKSNEDECCILVGEYESTAAIDARIVFSNPDDVFVADPSGTHKITLPLKTPDSNKLLSHMIKPNMALDMYQEKDSTGLHVDPYAGGCRGTSGLILQTVAPRELSNIDPAVFDDGVQFRIETALLRSLLSAAVEISAEHVRLSVYTVDASTYVVLSAAERTDTSSIHHVFSNVTSSSMGVDELRRLTPDREILVVARMVGAIVKGVFDTHVTLMILRHREQHHNVLVVEHHIVDLSASETARGTVRVYLAEVAEGN